MSCMTEKELCLAFNDADEGEEGFLSCVSALTRYFDTCEYRNEFVISYSSVQWMFEELSCEPKQFKLSSSESESCVYKKSEITRQYLPKLVDLIKAVLKWVSDEEPYEYNITNELIEPVMADIKRRFDNEDCNLKQHCFYTFFTDSGSGNDTYVFNGDFFLYLSKATPNYDELMDANAMTKRSRKVAEEEYNKELHKICDAVNILPVYSPLEDAANRIENNNLLLKDGYGEVWEIAKGLEYLDTIPMLLKFKTTYGYYEYYEEWDDAAADCEYKESNGVPAHNYVFLDVPEIKHQARIRKSLKEHILIGAKEALKIKSDTYTIWRNAYLSFLRSDYDVCISQIKEAEALIFADNVIKRYVSENKVIESAPKRMSLSKENQLLMYYTVSKCLDDTNKMLYSAEKNEISQISPPIEKRSELFQVPLISQMVGCFNGPFLERLLWADLSAQCTKAKKSIQDLMNEIKLRWGEFLRGLLSVSHSDSACSTVLKAISAHKEFFKVYERRYISRVDDVGLNMEVEEKATIFISSIEDLSTIIDLLEGKSFEELERVKDASSVLVGGFTEAGEKQLKLAVRKPRKNRHSEFRTQEQVAKDTGFSRKTINKWEREQTSDDTNNKSNKYEYYESLRTDPEKNGAYKIWVKIVVEYKKKKGRKKSFVSFREEWWEHNRDAITMLHLK